MDGKNPAVNRKVPVAIAMVNDLFMAFSGFLSFWTTVPIMSGSEPTAADAIRLSRVVKLVAPELTG